MNEKIIPFIKLQLSVAEIISRRGKCENSLTISDIYNNLRIVDNVDFDLLDFVKYMFSREDIFTIIKEYPDYLSLVRNKVSIH